MKIAICDDDILDLQSLQAMIWDYDVSLDVTAFRSASALLRAFDTMFFDIIFMDIEMEHPNGYEAAEILMQKKDKPLIIFVTNSGEYTIRGYGIAFRYLPKPLSATAVSDVLKLAIESITPQKIELDINDKKIYISISDIYYVEACSHSVVIHTKSGEFRCRTSLKSLAQKFPVTEFARPHNSFIVNLGKVHSASRINLVLTNNENLPISQRYSKSFDVAITQYIRRH